MLRHPLPEKSGLPRPGFLWRCVFLAAVLLLASCAGRLEPPPSGRPEPAPAERTEPPPGVRLETPPAERPESIPAPSPLPHVRVDFRSARFWASSYPGSGIVILKPGEIYAFNEKLLVSSQGVKDIFKMPGKIAGVHLKEIFGGTRAYLESKGFYNSRDRKIDKSYYDSIHRGMGDPGPEVHVRYGVITKETNVRAVPTDDLAKNKGTRGNFDHFQVAQIDYGTPAAVLHRTRDARWFYIETDSVSGWVAASDVAIGEKPKVQYFAETRPLVVTGKTVPFYLDAALRDLAMELDMGSTLPLLGTGEKAYEVVLPCRAPDGSLYIRSGYTGVNADVSRDFVPYTLENVYLQAFKLLDAPYSWGSKTDGAEDCSGFISSVFRCFGFKVPRQSSAQEKLNFAKRIDVAKLDDKGKLEVLRKVAGRPALLYKPGHIMLYLGIVDGRPYAIHSMWSYLEMEKGRERERLVRKVAVTDLGTGQGTSEGSYLQKLVSVDPID